MNDAERIIKNRVLFNKNKKICKDCSKTLSLDSFDFASKARGYRASSCKSCRALVSKEIALQKRMEKAKVLSKECPRCKQVKQKDQFSRMQKNDLCLTCKPFSKKEASKRFLNKNKDILKLRNNTPEQRKKIHTRRLAYLKKQSLELSSQYIKGVLKLTLKRKGVSYDAITDVLIEAKRIQLASKRVVSEERITTFGKICSKCGDEKHISDFGVNKITEDGFHHKCKECVALANYKSRLKEHSTEEVIQIYLNHKKEVYKRNNVAHNEKYCTSCEKIKLVSDFGSNRNTKDGLSCHCKECRRIEFKHYDAKRR